ncbi:phytyl ester synthase 1, chloroplastic isoform X1 [Lactuca sativa]|uniref:Serine aminopeptidase S33 domain-containing protein n=1 Tax=Lactuca sativa TaxID=4236 RepID=A0A9R1VA41_LACSA|nr:phytyl ester synthase 1, chloroplastic isoform X1 [Lactuca sativa]XP_042751826.1 phytyl ester synthase 1, chloroplastic isoform X1 [Lactuca sativa]KAJ0201093.1 hypothetical protein LSAT_V11C600328450 [Lactuca sativa]
MALLVSNSSVSSSSSPFLSQDKTHRLHSRVLVRSIFKINAASCVNRKNTVVSLASYENGGKKSSQNAPEKLEPLWDDGYGTQTMKDYTKIAIDLSRLTSNDGGPPRWFCPVACNRPLKDSPVLMYLPGLEGTGTGLVVHEKALGKVFHVQCLHIPSHDRTPFEGLIKIVEESVKIEQNLSPNKPIYLLGESFGAILALAVASRNPTIDLILILANSATAYERSSLHPLVGFMKTLPVEHYGSFPYLTSFLLGDFVKMAMVNTNGPNHLPSFGQLIGNLTEDIPLLSAMTTIIPRDTLDWRIKLLESAAGYANSRLHTITAQVLILASGKDNLLPSKDEAQRLSRLLPHCDIRVFEENGHTILMENGVNVLSAIKATQLYRHSSKFDIFRDFLPPSMTEFKTLPMEAWWYRLYMGASMFSTMEDGKIVRGLSGVPDEGPVLIVGNHLLWGVDVFSIVLEFLREKKTMIHGLAHPQIFEFDKKYEYLMIPYSDIMKLFGAIPVSGRNFFKLLARNSYTLLYPGGAREALHRKGEGCKLFWPDKQEFVRMAVKFGATIVPFGVVGEDDMSELLIDYNEMKKIPFLDQMVNEFNQGRTNLREGMGGEIAKQPLHFPIFLPKLPGRLYAMFGKPIRTKGKENMLDDKDYIQDLYFQIKCDVEKNMAYLFKKRDDDPYRSVIRRFVWQQMNNGDLDRIPSFDP